MIHHDMIYNFDMNNKALKCAHKYGIESKALHLVFDIDGVDYSVRVIKRQNIM